MKEKLKFISRTLAHYFNKAICPSCKSKNCIVIDRKYLISRLFECQNCHLYFRHPVDNVDFNKNYYQEEYKQKGEGITTDIPLPDELEVLKRNNFQGTSKSISEYINIFNSMFKHKIKIIDFGANWGYHSYQFKNAGFDVNSYEISVPRAKLGKKLLDIEIKTSVEELPSDNDIFFSSHVIEHLPDIPFMIQLAKEKLKKEGIFVAECPNGSKEFREKNPKAFTLSWGEVHPNLISADYYKFIFKDNPYFITSTPLNIHDIISWDKSSQISTNLSGGQLVIFAMPNKNLQ
ncbi:MAG: class I SAM-dependent methyltransferase [Bacteroidia bacterium]